MSKSAAATPSESRVDQTRLLGHVGESPPAVIAVQRVGRRAVGFRPAQRRPVEEVEEVDVFVAVAVVIDHGQAIRHRLDDVLLAGTAVVVDEGDARLSGHLDKLDRSRWTLLPAAVAPGCAETYDGNITFRGLSAEVAK